MNRITQKQLEAVALHINRLAGTPETSYTKTDTGVKANVGNYHLYYTYSRVGLVQMMNESGGVSTILPGGTKAELYYQMQAFLSGLTTKKGV